MAIQRLIPMLCLIFCFAGCEPEEEPAEALDGSQAFDVSQSADGSVASDLDVQDTGIEGGCESDEECSAPGTTCFVPDAAVNGICAECADNTYCPMERPFCHIDGLCQAESQGVCRDPLECEDPDRPLCLKLPADPIGTCVECTGDSDCVAPRSICSTTGICVARASEATCNENAECGILRRCVDGACQAN